MKKEKDVWNDHPLRRRLLIREPKLGTDLQGRSGNPPSHGQTLDAYGFAIVAEQMALPANHLALDSTSFQACQHGQFPVED